MGVNSFGETGQGYIVVPVRRGDVRHKSRVEQSPTAIVGLARASGRGKLPKSKY